MKEITPITIKYTSRGAWCAAINMYICGVMKLTAAAQAHFRTAIHSRLTTPTVNRAVDIPYVQEVMASMTKKTMGLTPYLLSAFHTTSVATTV